MKNQVNANISGIYPITPLQHAMVFYKMYDEEANSYVEQSIFRITGAVDEKITKEALELLASRYEVLRSQIVYEGVEKPLQVIFKERKIECNFIDISQENNVSLAVEQAKREDIKRDFNLSKDSLLRITYLKTADKEYVALWTFHHVIMDGWSFGLVQGCFQEYYRSLKAGTSKAELSQQIAKERKESADYGTYLKWLSTKSNEESLTYWKELLTGCTETTDIESLYRVAESIEDVETETYLLEDTLRKKAEQFARERKVTVNTVIESAFSILLKLYSRNQAITYGKVLSGRDYEVSGINEMVGLFVNTIPVVAEFTDTITVEELVEQLNKQALESGKYGFSSLGDVQNVSPVKGDLIKILYVFENYYVDDSSVAEGIPGMEIAMESAREKTNYDITFMAHAGEQLGFKIIYNPKRYSKEEIILLLERMEEILRQMMEHADKKISGLEFLTASEREKVLKEFNQSACPYPKEKTVAQLFEEAAAKYPDRIAVVSEEEEITYGSLNERANQVAHCLMAAGIQTDDPVVIDTKKNIALVVGLLGILKAGGAYVPVDADLPEERKQFILQDCQPKAVIGDHTSILFPQAVSLSYDDSAITSQSVRNPEVQGSASSLAYYMYTSGTTGNPKGTLIQNQNIVRLVKNQNFVPLNEDTVILQSGALAFDASTFEVWGSLLNGGKLCLVSKEKLTSPKELKNAIHQFGVNTIWFTSTLFNQMMNLDASVFDELNYLMIGGEKLSESHVRMFKERKGKTQLINGYGPTENTTFTTTYVIPDEFTEIPIGKPVSNTTVYVVNDGALCGIGVPGELLTGGDGLARGYLNQEELTAEKFIQNPYGEGRLYRTGDLVKWLPDGNVAYLGRIDEQVKLRGFRIELSEIENVLRKMDGVDNVAVVLRVDKMGEKAICAFYEGDKQKEKEIREQAAQYLPAYMMPSYFVGVETLPVTRNGKINKKALPEITIKAAKDYVAPRNEMEQKLADIYAKVLGLTKVSINDDFFEIGGHSLRATRVINEMESQFSVKLPIKEMFANPTVEKLAKLLQNDRQEDASYELIPKAEEKEEYPMSSAQKRIFLISQMGEPNTVYNMPFQFRFEGKVDMERLTKAYEKMVERNEILRTSFSMKGNDAVQHIEEQVPAEVAQLEVSQSEVAQAFHEFIKPFALDKAPLMRMEVVYTEEESILFLDMHHIISDGMTMGILMDQLTAFYNGEEVEPARIQYKDYSEWMQTRDLSGQKEYWLKQFEGEIPVLDMPYDYPRPQSQSFKGKTIQAFLKGKDKEYLEEFIAKTKTTDFMVLLSALQILLSRYSRQEDIVVGSVISARTHRDTEQVMGMFVNTLAFRTRPQKDRSYLDYLKEVKECCLAAYENQEYPFDELVDNLNIERDMSRNPLFDVMFAYQNNEHKSLKFANARQKDETDMDDVVAKFDMTLNAAKTEKEYMLMLEYSTDLFNEDSMERFLSNYMELLRMIIRYPNKKIGAMEIITKADQRVILNQFNREPITIPEDQCLSAMFEAMVLEYPEQIAVTYKEASLTYQELDKRSGQLAYQLQQHGVQPDDFVAVILNKGIDMMVAILGIIKAGAAYVPIDTEYPKERIQFILQDCQPKVIVAEHGLEIQAQTTVLYMEEAHGEETYVAKGITKHNLAYMIYTSGTTGQPKGTMVEQQSIIRLVSYCDYAKLSSQTIMLQTGAMSFDASTFEVWGSLLNGGTLCLADKEVLMEPEMLKNIIQKENVNTMWLTAALYNQMMDCDSSMFDSLNYLLIGGEKLSESHVRLMKQRKNGVVLVNGYGPTENTTFTTTYVIPEEFDYIPIGKPIQNTEVYVMNGNCLCGIKMPGELCIAGDGLSRGYLNRPELNEEKFTENPYGEGMLYRSGDLVRWREDGNIEFMGRIDQQVKIHGFRIELDEIKNVILKQDGVRDAAVIVREDQNKEKKICAYYVGEEQSELRTRLEEQLPAYMIPAFFQRLDQLPVTGNGKLNARALPDIITASDSEYVAPRDEMEQLLCEVFQEVLGIERVSIEDSFFELGGDSIKAIQVVSKARERHIQVAVKDVMNYKTVRSIKKHAKALEAEVYEQGEVTGEVALLPLQKEFFHQWKIGNADHFNQSMFLKKAHFDRDALRCALQELVVHHDMLRARYTNGTVIMDSVEAGKDYYWEEIDMSSLHEAELEEKAVAECNRIQKGMSLSEGPLLRAALFVTKEEEHLFLCIHHLAVDGVSWRILVEDLKKGYEQFCKEGEITLASKTASFKDWTLALKEYGQTEEVAKHKEYWDGVSARISQGNIKGDVSGSGNQEGKLKEHFIQAEKELSRSILFETGKKYNAEINDILLAGIGMAVQAMTGQEEVSVYLESHGRFDITKKIDISRTVGWFTSAYPVVLTMKGNTEASLLSTKETLHNVPDHGLSFGLLEGAMPPIDLSFNYLGQVESNEGDNDVEEIDPEQILNSELPTGENISQENHLPGNLIITGNAVNGVLSFIILYQEGKYSDDFAKEFGSRFLESLKAIAAMAIAQEEVVVTLSDIEASDVEDDDLDEINSLIDGLDF